MRELLAQVRSWHFPGEMAVALGNLCATLTALGQLDEALSIARECVPLQRRNGQVWVSLDTFAILAFKRGHQREAALTLGCSDAIRVGNGLLRRPEQQSKRDV